jgi:hypothetical protein
LRANRRETARGYVGGVGAAGHVYDQLEDAFVAAERRVGAIAPQAT